MPGRVVLLSGLPGSGKTTLARRLVREREAVLLSPDEWLDALGLSRFDGGHRGLLEARLWLLTQEFAAAGVTVVLDNGFWSRSERDRVRHWCRAHDVAVEVHALEVPLDELVERVARRDDPRSPSLDRAALQSYETMLEPVTDDERALFDPAL